MELVALSVEDLVQVNCGQMERTRDEYQLVSTTSTSVQLECLPMRALMKILKNFCEKTTEISLLTLDSLVDASMDVLIKAEKDYPPSEIVPTQMQIV